MSNASSTPSLTDETLDQCERICAMAIDETFAAVEGRALVAEVRRLRELLESRQAHTEGVMRLKEAADREANERTDENARLTTLLCDLVFDAEEFLAVRPEPSGQRERLIRSKEAARAALESKP